jgi:PiT family inorganic phosphate transporter
MYHITGGVLLGWAMGANDSANVFGTGVASGAVRFRTATVLTAVFALAGALLEGPRCMETLNSLTRLEDQAMLALIATLSAGLAMIVLTALSLPASTSQAVIGALIGIGLWNGSANFRPLIKVVICWLATPLAGALLAYGLYVVVGKAMQHWVKSIRRFDAIVRWGILVAGCYAAYALGANNAANATGPFVGVGLIDPLVGSLIAGLSIGFGAMTFSRAVMTTVGSRITVLGPLAAFIAMLAQGLTIHLFTALAVPVSTSQAIVGAVAGIGLVRGMHAVSRGMLIKIFAGWLSTPLGAGLLAYNAAGALAEIQYHSGG